MSATLDITEQQDMHASVLEVFAEVTRYPADILDPGASLEEDLGIDSVKLGEVFAVLRERYNLPETMDLPREQLRTIAGVASALGDFLGDRGNSDEPSPVETPVAGGNGDKPSSPDLSAEILDVFAEVTRYPADILDPGAGLEEDLGIDSVKLGEVFAVLRERYDLPREMDLPREQLRSISGVTTALREFLADRNSSESHDSEAGPNGGGNGGHAAPAVSAPPASTGGGNGGHTKPDLHAEVLAVFEEVTRYPAEILDGDAALEEDLGIDSVKLGEVFAVLRERYDLPEDMDLPREQLKTINGVAGALERFLAPRETAPVPLPTPPARSVEPANSDGNGSRLRTAAPEQSPVADSFAGLSPEQRPFDGKVAFITGSGRGIGLAISRYLSELGASVILNSFHSRSRGEEAAEEIRAGGGKATHYWGSVANPEHLEGLFDRIESEFGRLDFFIGNASNGMLARLEDITVEDWEKAFRTNIIGLHRSAMRSARIMKKQGGGKIITMSSPAAHGYVDYFGCMGAVKAAAESLTRSLAIELADDNIQVNCVSPGPVYGELLNKWPESERLIKQWEDNTAYERLCNADDVAHFVAYLLSDPVKLFTGSVLVMDGGISSQGW